MGWLRPNLRSLVGALADAARLWPLSVALAFAMTFATGASAQPDDGCSAPDALLTRAESLNAQWKAQSMREALDEFARARVCWDRAGLRQKEAGALKRIGDIHLSLSEYAPAIEAYEAALARWREVGDRQAEGHALVDLSRALLIMLRLDEALKNSQEAASIARAFGDRRLEARAENATGKFYYYRGDYQQAAAHDAQALSLAREVGDVAEEALALYQAGQVHGDVGDLSEALSNYQSTLPLWRAVKDRQGEIKTINSIGLTYAVLGESQTALDHLDKVALPFLRDAGDRKGEAAAHNNIGYVYQSLGDYETALSHYRDALAIFNQIKVVSGQARTLIFVGDMSMQLGREQEARENYERALPLVRSKDYGNSLLEADVLNRIGAMSLAAGKDNEAYELFRQALTACEKGKYQRGQAVSLNNIGWYFGRRGDWREAAAHFRQALGFCRVASDRLCESLSLYNIARADLELDNDASALSNVEAGLGITESLRTKVASSELRASYFASAHRQFELYIAVLMKLYKRNHDPGLAAVAFEASERGRARSLLEMLAEAHADIRRGVDPALLRRERELQFGLNAKAARRVRLLGAKTDPKEVAEIERQIDELMGEYQRLQGQIRASSPRYAALVQPAPLKLKETQQKFLDADTLLLEYSLGEERSFLWAVTPDSIKSFELPARAEIEKASRRVYELLTARSRQVKGETGEQWLARIRRAEGEYAEASSVLGRLLLGPVATELGRKRLVIVADGALQYIPFAALPVPSAHAGEKSQPEIAQTRMANKEPSLKESSLAASSLPTEGFIPLIAEHEVVSLPSASVLALTREEVQARRPAPKSVAVLADPVFDDNDQRLASAKRSRVGRRGSADRQAERDVDMAASGVTQRAFRSFEGLDEATGIARLLFSQREAKAIMASVPAGDGMLALGFRASLATAMSPELAQYRIVHFATHGLLNSEHPELSGIVLTLFDEAGKPEDGFLQLHEVYNLNLPADLVVLSACQTALGREIRGEGLVGLTRGFMYAGATRVIASLWKVDDAATAELMGEFYRKMLGEGLKPAAALRAAQVHMWRQNQWRSPYYWAAFTLQGEWR